MSAKKVKAIPDGYHTLTPHVTVRSSAAAIEFYKKAFGAEEVARMTGPDGTSIIHAEIQIGNSRLMMSDEMASMGGKSPESLGGCGSSLMIYTEDCDALFQRAVAAGAKANMPPMDMFWGDRWAGLTDPFGHSWQIATHKQDLTPEEIKKGQAAFFAEMAKQKG